MEEKVVFFEFSIIKINKSINCQEIELLFYPEPGYITYSNWMEYGKVMISQVYIGGEQKVKLVQKGQVK